MERKETLGARRSSSSWAMSSDRGDARRPRAYRSTWLLPLLWLGLAAPALGRGVETHFDSASLVSCRDVTTDEFAAAHPLERLVEARFQVTAIVEGQLPAAAQHVYQFLSPTGSVRVVDYQPKTEQASPVVGNVAIEKKKESSKSLGLSVSGSFESLVRGTAGSDLSAKNGANIRYELKPPMKVVLVAGTVDRGTGVYFKLRRSPDRPLEGMHEFLVVMQVPSSWRGDLMYLRCEWQQERHGEWSSQDVARFVIGLYREGDEEARLAAEQLVRSEALLRRTVLQQHGDIAKRATPSLMHRVGALLDVYDPRIPSGWLDQLVFGSANAQRYEFYEYLPSGVRQAADRYCSAKRRLIELSGDRLAMRSPPARGHGAP